jgi:hypothetical protein
MSSQRFNFFYIPPHCYCKNTRRRENLEQKDWQALSLFLDKILKLRYPLLSDLQPP